MPAVLRVIGIPRSSSCGGVVPIDEDSRQSVAIQAEIMQLHAQAYHIHDVTSYHDITRELM